jgi:TonB family protein
LIRFVDAVYPPDAMAQGIAADVRLIVDIGADGRVMNATVPEPVGNGFDEAALDAVKQFVFSPAESNGTPIPVRIEYTYTFFLDEVPAPPQEEPAPAEEIPRVLRIEGSLAELGSRVPVAGESVLLVETGALAVSDEDGAFQFYDLPAGTYTLQVPEGLYLEATTRVEVPAEGAAQTELRLKLDPETRYSTIVRGKVERSEPQRTDVNIEEARKIPGTAGDPLRAIQNLPGVARSPGLAGIVVIRGSNPNDSLFRLDGQILPQLYHFFGVFSVIPAEFIQEFSFYPGGFSTKYGDATGGLVEVTLRENRTDRWTGQIDANVFHAAAVVEGPVWEGGSLALGFRRSYIDAILPAVLPADTVGISTAPVYYDYQAKLEHRFNNRNKIRFLAFGSDDQLRLVLKQPSDDDPEVSGPASNHSYFHLGTFWWEHVFEEGMKLTSSLSAGQQQVKFGLGDALQLDLDLTRISWREDFEWKLIPEFTLLAGIDGEGIPGYVDVTGPLPPAEGEPQSGAPLGARDRFSTDRPAYFGRIALYTEAIARPSEDWILTFGTRYDAYFGDWQQHTMSPRGSFRWQVGGTTALKGGVGMYFRRPDFNQLDDAFGNPNLDAERALQTSLGIEQTIFEGTTLDLQGFYKGMSSLVRPTQTQTEGDLYDNGGVGRAYGFEVLLRQQLGKFFWGWLSYTFLIAERKDNEEDGWRPFDFDQRHVLTLVASFRLPWDLELSTRFRFTSGNPDTPVIGATFDSDSAVYSPVNGPINSDRLPDFHQLDVRLDKTWYFQTWTLVTYIEVWNTYNRMNGEFIDYNYDYSRKQTGSGLPIIPGFGLTARF